MTPETRKQMLGACTELAMLKRNFWLNDAYQLFPNNVVDRMATKAATAARSVVTQRDAMRAAIDTLGPRQLTRLHTRLIAERLKS